jgi:hypothetical protein
LNPHSYEAISTFLLSIGFRQSDEDECLFILINETENIHLAVYVDDLFISSTPSIASNF